jgi:chromatin remodeling complex protein RSC6
LTQLNAAWLKYEKLMNKTIRAIQKGKRKKMSAIEPKGFFMKRSIKPEVAELLDMDKDESVSRNDLTRKFSKYIKANELQNSKDGRKFTPDEGLAKVLGVPEGKEITYFIMQKYIKNSFVDE